MKKRSNGVNYGFSIDYGEMIHNNSCLFDETRNIKWFFKMIFIAILNFVRKSDTQKIKISLYNQPFVTRAI